MRLHEKVLEIKVVLCAAVQLGLGQSLSGLTKADLAVDAVGAVAEGVRSLEGGGGGGPH